MNLKIKTINNKSTLLFITFILSFYILEYLLRFFSDLPKSGNILEDIIILTIISILYIFSTKSGKIFIILFLIISIMIEVPNAFFYGTWINPINIHLLFENFNEVMNIIPSLNFQVLFSSLVFIFLFLGLLFTVVLHRYKNKSSYKEYSLVTLLTITLLSFQTVRDGFISYDKIGKRPTKDINSLIRSSNNALSVSNALFINKLLGNQLYQDYTSPTHNQTIPAIEPVNIIIYYGESLSAKYMSVFGYHKQTTPLLNNIQDNYKYALVKEAISGAVATSVSTQRFFNLIKYPDARKQIATSNTSLFKYASDTNHTTSYITTQAINYMGHIMNKLGKEYIDIDNNPYKLNPQKYGYKDDALDVDLLTMYKELNTTNPQFIVFQAIGSHAPFTDRTTSDKKIFGTYDNMIEYENSVLYTDFILGEILKNIEESFKNRKWVFIITSDHGTYINKEVISRSTKYPESYTVPMIMVTNDEKIYDKYIKPLSKCQVLFHQQAAQTIGNLLGYDIPISECGKGIMMDTLYGIGTKNIEVINQKAKFSPFVQEKIN